MIQYLIPLITSFSLTVTFIIVSMFLARKIKWHGRKSGRHIHSPGIFRIGGVAMILAFNLSIIFNPDLVITQEFWAVMAASLIIMIVGTWDDLKEIFWESQLFYQVALAILVFIVGVRIYSVTNPLSGGIIKMDMGLGVILSVLLVITWIVLMINAMNWIDGIDGLSGGLTFIGAFTIFVLSLKPEVNQPPVAILAMMLCGASLGFLIFNFNPSKILAGTSGSMFMGFILAVLAIFAGTKIATALLAMAIPIIDFIWVILERIKNKRSIFKPDRSHLHYKLIDLGWSQRKITALYYFVTVLIALVALNTRFVGKLITLLVTGVIMLIFLFVIGKKTSIIKLRAK